MRSIRSGQLGLGGAGLVGSLMLAGALASCGGRGDDSPPVTGEISTLSFATSFILDVSQVSSPDYRSAHPEATQTSAAFSGHWGRTGAPIPASGSTLADARNVYGRIMVGQETEDSQTNSFSPSVLMAFPQGAVAVGTWAVGAGPTEALLLVNRVSDMGMCVEAIAMGHATVTMATDTDAPDGGSLAVQGSRIQLYYPTATPEGDVSAVLQAEGAILCP